jgi:hypothetical protein
MQEPFCLWADLMGLLWWDETDVIGCEVRVGGYRRTTIAIRNRGGVPARSRQLEKKDKRGGHEGVSARKMCRTYGARGCVKWYPALTRWANLCRAYGAGFLRGELGVKAQGSKRIPLYARNDGFWRRQRGRATGIRRPTLQNQGWGTHGKPKSRGSHRTWGTGRGRGDWAGKTQLVEEKPQA